MNKEIRAKTVSLEATHPMALSVKIWGTFLSHCVYYAVGIAFIASLMMFMGYFFNFYGLSDGLLVWGSVIFFTFFFIASFFALHQSLGRYIAVSSLEEVLKKEHSAPDLTRRQDPKFHQS